MTRIWHGAAVVTGRRRPEGMETITGGAVAVEGDRIVAVGTSAQIRAQFPDAQETHRSHHLLMPGFVNGHHHQGVSPVRLGARSMSLEHVFTHRRALRGPALYEDTLFGAVQLLAAGITTVNHLHVGRRGPWTQWRQDAETVLTAYRDAGIRVNFTFNFRDQNRLVYDGDGWFSDNLPASLAGQMRDFLKGQEVPLDAYLAELFVGLWESSSRNTGPHARVSLAPHNLHWCSDEAIQAVAETAREYDVHMNMHLLESPRQKLYATRRTGTTAIRHLHDLGVLDERLTLLHAVWATSSDIDLLAEAQTRVCTSVGSNLLMGSGIAPLALMRAKGVPLSLGLDEGGLDGRSDVFSDLRLTQGVHQQPDLSTPTLPCDVLLEMATSGAAASTEFRHDIGTLEQGRYADLLVVNWDSVNDPIGPTGPTDIDDLVYKASNGDIAEVVVGGVPVVEGGRHASVDRDALGREIRDQLRAEPSPDERRRLDLMESIRSSVDSYWASYGQPESAHPYYAYNSCD